MFWPCPFPLSVWRRFPSCCGIQFRCRDTGWGHGGAGRRDLPKSDRSIVEKLSFHSTASLAAGQWLPLVGPPSPSALLFSLLRVNLPNPHWNGQHLDPPDRLPGFCYAGNLHASLVRTADGRALGLCGFLRRGHPVLGLLLRFPHGPLPLGVCRQTLLKTGLCGHILPNSGITSPMALLQLLLSVPAQSDLFKCSKCARVKCHHSFTVGPVCWTWVQVFKSR